MLESDIVQKIKKNVLDKLPRAFFFKVHGGPYQAVGIPDLIGCYQGCFVAIEVKRPGKEPTSIQEAVMAKLRNAGAFVCVATSVDEAQQLIAEIDRHLAA